LTIRHLHNGYILLKDLSLLKTVLTSTCAGFTIADIVYEKVNVDIDVGFKAIILDVVRKEVTEWMK